MKLAVAILAAMLILSACSSASEDQLADAADSPLPALQPGALATGEVTIDGTTVQYISIVPEGFAVGDIAPVLLAFPPGGQDFALTRSVAEGTYLAEALARGWVVISPAAPNDQLFFNGSETLVPGLLDWIESWVTPEGGAVHMGGISNGGISTFRAATQNPDRVKSILVFPGFARSDADRAALAGLAQIPVRMFVGDGDTSWITSMEETRDELLANDGDVTLEIVPDEGHIIGVLADGVRIFDELDRAR